MGVRGLQTFMEKDCPDSCKFTSIKELADAHSSIFNVKPALVVDGSNWLCHMFTCTDLEWVYGGQWLQFVGFLKNFILKFQEIGVDLVFFFDGTVCESKREEWIRRRVRNYEGILHLFRAIRVNYCEPYSGCSLPAHLETLCCFIMEELGTTVHQTYTDADYSIAEYAMNHEEVFAILSQDSDFVIFNTKIYLSMNHLDMDSLCTIWYDRKCLASQYLHLPVKKLPLFACLMGNDFIQQEKMDRFHLSLSKTGLVYLGAIAENLCKFISAEGWNGDIDDWQELADISRKVFGNMDYVHLIRDGLKSYAISCNFPPLKLCINVNPRLETVMYDRHYNCLNAPFIFDLLCKMEFRQREVLEDESRQPCALVFRETRQRCYGVLFNCFVKPFSYTNPGKTKAGEPVIISEWCAHQGNFMKKPDLVKPMPLAGNSWIKNASEHTYHAPRIEDVWFKFTTTEKLRLFWHVLQIPMDFDLLVKLPNDQIVLACILSSLIGGLKSSPLVMPLEVAALVAQAVWNKSIEDLEKLPIPWVDAATVNLSTLFLCGVATVFMVLSTCGSPFPAIHVIPWRYFDGKLFHYLYNEARVKPNIHHLCRNRREIVQEFYILLRVVTSNTVYDVDKFDWGNILEDFER